MKKLALIAISLMVSAVLLFMPSRVNAQIQSCDLALVLAMDASSSVNAKEYDLQLKGMAAALLDIEVKEAILSLGGMYMVAFEWNGRANQKFLFEWTRLSSEADIFKAARKLALHERNSIKSPTALGSALGYAHRLFPQLPTQCLRQVIDVSGDGLNNDGITPAKVYALWDFSNITVNGLAIKGTDPLHDNIHQDIDDYYRQQVLRGNDSFLIIAENFQSFANAMKQKLLKEIRLGPVGLLK